SHQQIYLGEAHTAQQLGCLDEGAAVGAQVINDDRLASFDIGVEVWKHRVFVQANRFDPAGVVIPVLRQGDGVVETIIERTIPLNGSFVRPNDVVQHGVESNLLRQL